MKTKNAQEGYGLGAKHSGEADGFAVSSTETLIEGEGLAVSEGVGFCIDGLGIILKV